MSTIKMDVESTTPSTPSASKGKLYFKSDNIPYALNEDGTEFDLTAAAGARWITIAISDETTDLTTGAAKGTLILPYGYTVASVFASVTTAPTGTTLIFDINEGGVSILSTKISIDVSENHSGTAATPPVISDSSIAQYAVVTFDIDQIGSGTAGAGAKISMYITPV